MTHNEELLKESLETRQPVLFLGAGFSLGSFSGNNEPLMLASNLSKKLYEKVIDPEIPGLTADAQDLEVVAFDATHGRLQQVCDFIENYGLTDKRNSYFVHAMANCGWEETKNCFSCLLSYSWAYIFTLNIDDLVENIYKRYNRPIDIWTSDSAHYEDPIDKPLLVKLHGDINSKSKHFVFSSNEYTNYIAKDDWMIQKFTDLYLCHDVIFVGTNFQENDIDIALSKAFSRGCTNKGYKYFFVSPGEPSRALIERMHNSDNVYHIPLSNIEFLTFLQKEIQDTKTANRKLSSIGFVIWNEEIKEVEPNESSTEMYFGGLPCAADFVHHFDIPRVSISEPTIKFIKHNSGCIVALYGDSYVGKTSIAKRILTDLVGDGYNCYYLSHTESVCIRQFESSLHSFSKDSKIAICLENSGNHYKKVRDLFEKNKDKFSAFCVITTSETRIHSSKSYLLECPVYFSICITPHINKILANDIYKTLKAKDYLNNLSQLGTPSVIKKKELEMNDLIEVLYYAHEATGIEEYFFEWKTKRQALPTYRPFCFLYLLAIMGTNHIKISIFPVIARIAGAPNIAYHYILRDFSRVCDKDHDYLYMRCTRLIKKAIPINSLPKEQWLEQLANYLGSRVVEGHNTPLSDMYENILAVKNMHDILSISWDKLSDFFDSLYKNNRHLSYYWIQRGTIYRNLHKYEQAENALSNAKQVHGYESYQIKHAHSKNQLEWGLALCDSNPNLAQEHFNNGCGILLDLIHDNRYKDAIRYSIHTYLDMNMKYNKKMNTKPAQDEWRFWCICLSTYTENTSAGSAHLKSKLIDEMLSFSNYFKLPFDVAHYRKLL